MSVPIQIAHSSPFWIAENLYAHLAHAAEPLKSTYAPLIVLFDHYILSEVLLKERSTHYRDDVI